MIRSITKALSQLRSRATEKLQLVRFRILFELWLCADQVAARGCRRRIRSAGRTSLDEHLLHKPQVHARAGHETGTSSGLGDLTMIPDPLLTPVPRAGA